MGVLFQIAVVHAHLLTLERALAVLAEGIDVGEVSAPVRWLSVTFAGRDNSFLCTFVIQLAPVMFLLAAVVTSAPVQRPFGDSEEDAPSTTQSVTPNFTRHFLGCLAAACVLIAIVPLNAELLSLGSSPRIDRRDIPVDDPHISGHDLVTADNRGVSKDKIFTHAAALASPIGKIRSATAARTSSS